MQQHHTHQNTGSVSSNNTLLTFYQFRNPTMQISMCFFSGSDVQCYRFNHVQPHGPEANCKPYLPVNLSILHELNATLGHFFLIYFVLKPCFSEFSFKFQDLILLWQYLFLIYIRVIQFLT